MHTTTLARQSRNQTILTLDYEHVSGGGYYGDCPLPLDECPSAEKGLEAENNYIEYLDLSKYVSTVFRSIFKHLIKRMD